MRILILGNSGSGKTTLGVRLSKELNLPFHELDNLLWCEGWVRTPKEEYVQSEKAVLGSEKWIVEGLGEVESIPQRIDRSTHIILCDFPIWQNFWLAGERQNKWKDGSIELLPGGLREPPPTRAVFETIWMVEQHCMPTIRSLVLHATNSKSVKVVSSFEDLQKFEFDPN